MAKTMTVCDTCPGDVHAMFMNKNNGMHYCPLCFLTTWLTGKALGMDKRIKWWKFR